MGALLVLLMSWLGLRSQGVLAARFASSAQVRYFDARGKELPGWTAPANADASPADLRLEVSLSDTAASTRAALFLFDRAGRPVGDLIALDREGEALRTTFSLRMLPPLSAPWQGLLLIAPRSTLDGVLRNINTRLDLQHAKMIGVESGVQSLPVEIRIPGVLTRYDPRLLEAAEQLLSQGDFSRALAHVEALAASLPESDQVRAALIAAEAAFGFGRTALARGFAQLALTSARVPLPIQKRLLRVQILAIAEGSEATEPPPEREHLRQSALGRADDLNQALDAALDLRLALLHDRFSREPPRAPERARELLSSTSALEPARLTELAASLCRAVEVAADRSAPYAHGTLDLASALVRSSHNAAAIADCAIASGELFIKRSQWADAENAVTEALGAVSGRDLPRQQRQAWYLAATLAAQRKDLSSAFEHAQRAVRWVGRLLALETEPAAREQLLVNTLAYYCAAERFGILAGPSFAAAAIAVAESGKGNSLMTLIQGAAPIDDNGPWSETTPHDASQDDSSSTKTARISDLARQLSPKDAALSYTLLGMNEARRFELAIGVLTHEGVSVQLVEEPDSFLTDVLALAEAVERNREGEAKVFGMRLYATLIAPVAARLVGKDRLFISPHLRLHALPWNALHDGSDFLVHRFAFSRSLPFLLRDDQQREDASNRQPASARWLLALNPRHAEHESLPAFEVLGRELASRMPSATVLTSHEATAERLAVEIRHADVLLFAGHAVYDPSEPLRSALFTAASATDAMPSRWPHDRLEARALLKLEKRLQLAILLGCETARLWRGRSSYGDEAVGLSRAFLLTRVQRVIGALWPVLDRDAEDFLRAFVSTESGQGVVRGVQQANRCLAQGRCASRGIVAWASFSVESR